MEFEAKIPVARDPSGILVTIDEAKEYPRYYRCIECNDFLQVRHGDIKAWYFAHYPQKEDSPVCSLRTIVGIKILLEGLRKSPIEKAEESHNLRIVIKPNYYTGIAKVFALIRNPFSELVGDMAKVSAILDTLKVAGNGLLNEFDKRLFHPSRPLVHLELDPNTMSYELNFESSPQLKDLNGQWVSKGINIGDIFAGDSTILERVEKYRKISESDFFYEVIEAPPAKTNKVVFRIGKRFVIERKIEELIIQSDDIENKSDLSLKSFEVDIIEPRLSDPWGRDVIYGSPNSEVLLAIRPRKGLDPFIEIVSVPETANSIVEIGRVGQSKIRYYRLRFPLFGSKRITIHHLYSHVYLHFFATMENSEKIDLDMEKSSVGITYINNENKIETVFPWENRTIFLKRDSIPKLKLFYPEGLSIEMDVEPSKEGSRPFTQQTVKDLNLLNLTLAELAEEGLKSFLIKFKAFGSINIKLVEKRQKKGVEEIAEWLRSSEIDPHTKFTWQLLRKICGAAPGTSHRELREIVAPNNIRRALKKLLKEGDNVE